MTILDKVIAAVTPPETDADRAQARDKARSASTGNDWLALVLAHHLEIEQAFLAVSSAGNASAQRAAQKQLATILTGHANAEETVLYPALALGGEKGDSHKAYTEQSAARVQMAALDDLEPLTQDYLDQLEQIRTAVAHHVYEEEGTWFPQLRQSTDTVTQTRLTQRYREEFERYMGNTGMTGTTTLPG
jgi:hemerythrin superfamily protein